MYTEFVGYRSFPMSRDEDGHREYVLKSRIKVVLDVGETYPITIGPATALQTPGLPLPGSTWTYGTEVDNYATCRLSAEVSPVEEEGNPVTCWDITQRFSTRPTKKCQLDQFEDPTSEPPKISGSFTKRSEEATHAYYIAYNRGVIGKFGSPIINSAHEQIRGPQVEFDVSDNLIIIEQNVPNLQMNKLRVMVNTVNDRVLWGQPIGTVKLNPPRWSQECWGPGYIYYKRTLEFEVNKDGFSRQLLDEGTKALSGKFNATTGIYELININGAAPDKNNPQHFVRFQDRNGNYCKVILDGNGKPANALVSSNDVAWWCAQNGTIAASSACQQITCSDAIAQAIALGGIVKGPFLSENDCLDQCSPTGIDEYDWAIYNPNTTTCAGTATPPGTVYITKYPYSNFLELGIPVTIQNFSEA